MRNYWTERGRTLESQKYSPQSIIEACLRLGIAVLKHLHYKISTFQSPSFKKQPPICEPYLY